MPPASNAGTGIAVTLTWVPAVNMYVRNSGTAETKQKVDAARPKQYKGLKVFAFAIPDSIFPKDEKNKRQSMTAKTS